MNPMTHPATRVPRGRQIAPLPDSSALQHIPHSCWKHPTAVVWALLVLMSSLSALSQPIPLNYGQTTNGTISSTSQFGQYSFSGVSGDRLTIAMSGENGCGLNPEIQLYAPDATLLTNVVGN